MPKLLLADDSPTTQKVVQLTFADEGIEVVVAADGDAAMELYDQHHPDIVLADINMPGLNGYEVCEAIRKRESNGSTPVILLAGSFEPFDVEEARRVGASDYLTKPFSSIRRLVATVTAMLDTVTRSDRGVDETIEPTSIQHNVDDPVKASVVQAEPGVVPHIEEPDMTSTSDIEQLYSQSVIDSEETVAARPEATKSDEVDSDHSEEAPLARDEVGFDDELIETTFTVPREDPAEHYNQGQSDVQATLALDASAPQIEMPDLPPEISPAEIPQSQIPTVSFNTVSEPQRNTEALGWVPRTEERSTSDTAGATNPVDTNETEEFQLDQSADETYFEPTAETVEANAGFQSGDPEIGSSQPLDHSQATSNRDAENEPAHGTLSEDMNVSLNEPYDQRFPDQAQEATQHPVEMAPAAADATPWDSVAGEMQPPGSYLDESNLLELPTDFATQPEPDEVLSVGYSDVAERVSGLAPEIVDRIAKETATQISEELVREIARRIVPKVVEEVIARQRGEDPDR